MATADAPQPDAEELVRFVRMACHGLRNPLAIATGMLDMLERLAGDQLDDDALDLLDRSSVAVRRTADMVLSVQRHVGAQYRPLQTVPVDLGEVVGWITDGLDVEAIVVRVDGALPMITADRDMVEWVVHELLDNARKHADREDPVTVVIDAEEGDGGWLVTLTDDGVGIPAERRDDVFAEGERLERVGGGLGVGLSTVRRVMDRHGGDVRLEGAPGGGLRVALTWPD